MEELELIVVRHGNYNRGGKEELNEEGRSSIKQLTNRLKSLIQGKKTIILSSTIPRAFESATIIGEGLGVDIEGYDILWSDDNHIENLPAIFNLIESHAESDVIIVVTHCEYTEYLPLYFGEKYLNRKSQNRLRSFVLDYGEAWLINGKSHKEQILRLV